MAKKSKLDPDQAHAAAEPKIKKTKKKNKNKDKFTEGDKEPLPDTTNEVAFTDQGANKKAKASSKAGGKSNKRKRADADDELVTPNNMHDTEGKTSKSKKKKRKQSDKSKVDELEPAHVAPLDADTAEEVCQEKAEKKKKKKNKDKVRPSEEIEAGTEAPAKESKRKKEKVKEAVEDCVPGDTVNGDAAADPQELAEPVPAADTPARGGQTPQDNSNGEAQDPGSGKATNTSFRRVKSEEWVGKRGSMDNTYAGTFGAAGWGFKAQQVLGQVRGKDFRHEKTKKKRGSYMGGKIDSTARFSFKYDSD